MMKEKMKSVQNYTNFIRANSSVSVIVDFISFVDSFSLPFFRFYFRRNLHVCNSTYLRQCVYVCVCVPCTVWFCLVWFGIWVSVRFGFFFAPVDDLLIFRCCCCWCGNVWTGTSTSTFIYAFDMQLKMLTERSVWRKYFLQRRMLSRYIVRGKASKVRFGCGVIYIRDFHV